MNCDPNAACTNTIGSYECGCNEGYDGDGLIDGLGCANVDECDLGIDECALNATCAGLLTCVTDKLTKSLRDNKF